MPPRPRAVPRSCAAGVQLMICLITTAARPRAGARRANVGFGQQANGWVRALARRSLCSDFYENSVAKPFAIIEDRDDLGGDPDQKDAFLAGQCVSEDLWKTRPCRCTLCSAPSGIRPQ